MSSSDSIKWAPGRGVDLSSVQFSSFDQVRVADYSQVQYFQPEPSDDDIEDAEAEPGKMTKQAIHP